MKNYLGCSEGSNLRKDKLGHGTALADVIGDEYAKFTCAQVFDEFLVTNARTISYAINYLLEQKVDLIHLSLGLFEHREMLKNVIDEALSKKVTIVASSATLSKYKIFPACYKGVISVTADARCKKNSISYINTNRSLLGASPFSNNENVRGSSVAAAYISKEIAWLHSNGIENLEEQIKFIKANALYKMAQPRLSLNRSAL